jgi:hypothetical protein
MSWDLGGGGVFVGGDSFTKINNIDKPKGTLWFYYSGPDGDTLFSLMTGNTWKFAVSTNDIVYHLTYKTLINGHAIAIKH